MRVSCLVENTAVSDTFEAEHGLCLFIETEAQQVLFDFGASTLFISNAKRLGISLADVDFAVLSHGHYDHGGGMKAFLGLNEKAKIYLHQNAFEAHYSDRGAEGIVSIGLNSELQESDRLLYTGKHVVLSPKFILFSDVRGQTLAPKGNQSMLTKREGGPYTLDGFEHEQNLIVFEGEKAFLFAGCAHKGIVNIVKRAAEYIGRMPDAVFGGFHLKSRNIQDAESPERIQRLGETMLATGAKYYTGHCTGADAFQSLKSVMGDQVNMLSTGKQINL